MILLDCSFQHSFYGLQLPPTVDRGKFTNVCEMTVLQFIFISFSWASFFSSMPFSIMLCNGFSTTFCRVEWVFDCNKLHLWCFAALQDWLWGEGKEGCRMLLCRCQGNVSTPTCLLQVTILVYIYARKWRFAALFWLAGLWWRIWGP